MEVFFFYGFYFRFDLCGWKSFFHDNVKCCWDIFLALSAEYRLFQHIRPFSSCHKVHSLHLEVARLVLFAVFHYFVTFLELR